MTIQLSDITMPVQQMSPLAGLGGGQNLDIERQRLELERQRFEESRRQQQEEQQFRRMEEAGRNARQQLQLQQSREEHAAVEQQKTMDERRKALDAMLKHRDAANWAGMEEAATQLNALGGYAERLGADEHGFPTYRVGLDGDAMRAQLAAQAAQTAPQVASPYDYNSNERDNAETAVQSLNRLNALGPMAGRSPEAPEPGFNIDDPATRSRWDTVIAARENPETAGLDMHAPVHVDPMASVPADVLDTGAEHAQALQSLNPALAALQKAYPDAYQQSVGASNEAAAALNLPNDKAMELALNARKQVDEATAKELEAPRKVDAEKEKERFELEKQGLQQAAAAKLASDRLAAQEPERIEKLRTVGSNLARHDFQDQGLHYSLDAIRLAEHVKLLAADRDTPEGKLNQHKIVNDLMQLSGNKGAQTEPDAARAVGTDIANWSTKMTQFVNQWIEGGYAPELLDAMTKYANDMEDQQKARVKAYMDQQLHRADTHPNAHVGEGIHVYLEGLPKDIVSEYEKESGRAVELPKNQDSSAPGVTGAPTSASIDDALRAVGLDPEKAKPTLGLESGGGNPRAVNPTSGASGFIQFTDKTARKYTNPNTGKPFANAAEFGALPIEQQAPIGAKYLKDQGLDEKSTPEDYAMAVAAPGARKSPGSTVVYPKGSQEWEQNPKWRPPGGGDITKDSILKAYGLGGAAPAGSTPAAKRARSKADQAALEMYGEANQ